MGVGPLIPIYEPLEGKDYAQLLEENIPRVKEILNVRTASFIEDHSSVHGTSNVLDVKEALQLKNLDLPTYSQIWTL